MDRHDDDARRWARPAADDARAPSGRDGASPEQAPHSAASHWTRGTRPTREPVDAPGVPVPALPWEQPPAAADEGAREPRMWPIAAGVAGLAVLACTPHWVAPTIALMVSLVGIPIAWGFRRISHGRRRVQYVVVVLTLLLTATLSIVAPMLWLQLGVLQPLTVPT
ncbi:hypothetical protein ACVWW9_001333 [Agrococcus sp. UYP33]